MLRMTWERAMGTGDNNSLLWATYVMGYSMVVYGVVAFSLALLRVTMFYKATVCLELLHVEYRCQDRTPPCLSKQTAVICQHTRIHKLINDLSMPISNACECIKSHRNTGHEGLAMYRMPPHTRTIKGHHKTAIWPCMPSPHSQEIIA